jgi:hypothetical protein
MGIFIYLLCFNFISLLQFTIRKKRIEMDLSTMQQKIAETALLQTKTFAKDLYLKPTQTTERKNHE